MRDAGQQPIQMRLEELKPTQVAVGYDEVEFKRQQWRARTDPEKARLISEHPFPAVRGPDGKCFMIDGHHLGLALLKEGVDVVLIKLVEDYSHMDDKAFWRAMDRNGFRYLSDVPRGELGNAPETLQDLIDDPYRSLVARLRRNCHCPKYAAPFAEFRWADYLRRHIQIEALKTSPDGALKIAKKLIWEGICSLVSSECRCLGPVESS
jgi:hypothetical protein